MKKYKLLRDWKYSRYVTICSGSVVLLRDEEVGMMSPDLIEELPESQEEPKGESNCCKCPCRECVEDMPHEHAVTNSICPMFCKPQKEECKHDRDAAYAHACETLKPRPKQLPSVWIDEEQERLAQKLESNFGRKLSGEEYERLGHRATLNFLDSDLFNK